MALSIAWLLPVPLGCIAVLAPAAIPVPRHTMLPRGDDAVLAWLEAHAPAGSTVLLESGVVPLLDLVGEPGPFGLAVRRSLVTRRPGLDLRYVGAVYLGGHSNYRADLLTAERVDFAVISMRNVLYVEPRCDTFADVCAFYRDLRARGRIGYATPDGVESAIVYDVRGSRELLERDAPSTRSTREITVSTGSTSWPNVSNSPEPANDARAMGTSASRRSMASQSGRPSAVAHRDVRT
jgi:hypothetical protein